MAFHFDSSASNTTTPASANSVSTKVDSSEVSDRAAKLAEFSRAVERATQEAILNTNIEDEPPRPVLKTRRSSIAEGKPSIVFKQLAERRKISTNSSHPLDPKFSTPPEDRGISEARVLSRASSSPPPLRNITSAVPFSSIPPESTSGEGSILPKKKGTVSGLAHMFANHQFMHQPGAAPPIKKKHDSEELTGDQQLAGLTTSRPITERRRRPTVDRRSEHILSMKIPLALSTSSDENETQKLSEVIIEEENGKPDEEPLPAPPIRKGSISPQPAGRKLTSTNPLLIPSSLGTNDHGLHPSPIQNSSQYPPPIPSGKTPPPPPVPPHPIEHKPIPTTNIPHVSPPLPPSEHKPPPLPPSEHKPPPLPPSEHKPPPLPPSVPPPLPKAPPLEHKTPSEPTPEHKPPLPPTEHKLPPPLPAEHKPPPYPPLEHKPLAPIPARPEHKPPPLPPASPPPVSAEHRPPLPLSEHRPPPPMPVPINSEPSQASQKPSLPPAPLPISEHKPTTIPEPNQEQSFLNKPPPPVPKVPQQLSVQTEDSEVTFSFEDERSSEFQDLDRLSSDSARAKNAAYFRQMKEEEERKRQEKLSELTPEERERLSLEEDAAKAHDQSKVNHFSKLGKSFAVSSSSKLLSGGRGRGGTSGRGTPIKKALP